jgi:hypothetical protein
MSVCHCSGPENFMSDPGSPQGNAPRTKRSGALLQDASQERSPGSAIRKVPCRGDDEADLVDGH